MRYQLIVGENIGAGDVPRVRRRGALGRGRRARAWRRRSSRRCPSGYDTQLGRWFKDGRELSGGQWQKVALVARVHAHARPTSSCSTSRPRRWTPRPRPRSSSASATLTDDQIAILISHRFSTVRMADQIVVLHDGRIIERGSHEELLRANGRYARLFELQARGYQ